MKNKYLGMVAILALFVTTINCSKNDPLGLLDSRCETAWTEQVGNELDAYSNAVNTYSSDPTEANCNSVKSAAQAYFDALGGALECVPTTNRASINMAINEAKAEVDREGCD